MQEALIFDYSCPGRVNRSLYRDAAEISPDLPASALRRQPASLPAVSELDVVRHFTRLSTQNFSIDGQFYPLGSCTMKYNPKVCHEAAMLPGFLSQHPYTPDDLCQGSLAVLYELQVMLAEVTGMADVALSPMAGAQGELAGVAMIRAYHESRQDTARTTILIPDAAHGTNPASAVMCGYKVREIPTLRDGDLDLAALQAALGPDVAGIMLTNPSTLGVFERQIGEISRRVHAAGGLLYYDGANLNAILGKVRPGDMGFDVIHLNLHKTFATPHGGGGPGAGPVGVSERLRPFLPTPRIDCHADGSYRLIHAADAPASIGQLSAFMGNAGVLFRAYAYMRLLGREGMVRVAEYATLNANYLCVRLRAAGFQVHFPERRATHEFIISFKSLLKETGINAMLVAKCLLDKNMHAPTTYFPALVPECFLIEPTETESKATLDAFVDALIEIMDDARNRPDQVAHAPHSLPVKRLDDVAAARNLDLTVPLHP